MAERPIFIPAPESPELVRELPLPLQWAPGFARSQKEKNVAALHESARLRGYAPVLEISTKSNSERGRHMSAFHIKVPTREFGRIKLELAFQGSKVFEGGGPYTDLYTKGDDQVGEAKRDPRLRNSGRLIGFRFEGMDFPSEPKTGFYDWLYCSFLGNFREWAVKLYSYAAFSDIEFNPTRSINCQARSAALFVSLMKRGDLDAALRSPADFFAVLAAAAYDPQLQGASARPKTLFATGG